MFNEVEVRGLWSKVCDSQDSLIFFGFQEDLAKLMYINVLL